MKKFLVSVCLVALVFALSAGALAVPKNVTYETTRQFLQYCDDNSIKYTFAGIDDDNQERVTVGYNLTNTAVDVVFIFDEDQETCALRVWNLIEFDPAGQADVAGAVDTANRSYRWVRFFVDTSDNTVTCAADLYLGKGDAGEICGYLLDRVVNICDIVYDESLGQLKK